MQLSDLQKYLKELPEAIKEDAAHIVAETATEYFKGSFRKKAFDGKAWQKGRPKRRGSLLIDSGALLNSIRPSHVSSDKVVISAGNDKVDYAKAHNEGWVGNVAVKAHQRRIRGKVVEVRAHQRTARIVQRQFMGNSRELNQLIVKRIEGYLRSLEN